MAFTLASGAPATLELFDVRGRRAVERAVGALGPGAHELRRDEAAALAPGIYVVRLSQGGRVVVGKVVLIR